MGIKLTKSTFIAERRFLHSGLFKIVAFFAKSAVNVFPLLYPIYRITSNRAMKIFVSAYDMSSKIDTICIHFFTFLYAANMFTSNLVLIAKDTAYWAGSYLPM